MPGHDRALIAVHCGTFSSAKYRPEAGEPMTKRVILGLAIGTAVTIVLAALITTGTSPAGAQMSMQHQGMMDSSSSTSHMQPLQHGKFSANGASLVDGVEVTGISITGDDEISVNLRYAGAGEAPNLTLIATTNPSGMMNRVHGGGAESMSGGSMGGMSSSHMMGQGMMSGSQQQMTGQPMVLMNSTGWQQWHEQQVLRSSQNMQMTGAKQGEVGSAILDAGWTAAATVKIALGDDDISAYDALEIMIVVFPRA